MSGQCFTLNFDDNPNDALSIYDAYGDFGGGYDITATINHAGQPLGETLTIDGYIPDLLGSHGTGTLLTGTL